MGGHRASRGVNLIKALREKPNNADHQEALRLWMAYSQIETRAQFVRLLGLGESGRNLTRRWEKNPTDALAQRPGVVSLRRMLYLVWWQMTDVLYISDLDEVDWNRMFVYPRDELKPPVSPFLKVVGRVASGGVTRQHTKSIAPPKNIFRLSLRLLVKRNYPYLLRETGLGRLLGLKTHRDMSNAYRWKDGRHQMDQDANIRLLIVLLWDALGIAKASKLWGVDWDTRVIQWYKGRETRMRDGAVLNPLRPLHTVPAIRNYLLSRGIDPFTKPPARPRKLFDPYEHTHTPLLTQRAQIITVHPDYRRGGVGPA